MNVPAAARQAPALSSLGGLFVVLWYLTAPITALMGFAAFHETLSPAALLGFAITVGGVYLGTR